MWSSTDQWSSRCPHNTNQDEKFLSNQIVPFFFFFPKTVGVHQTMLENVVGSNFQRDFFKNKLMTIV
jgi:hypothetical protein